MGFNIKTNIWGLLAAAFSIGKVIVDVHNGHGIDTTNVMGAIAGISAGLGLTQAKDNNVVGAGATAIKVHTDGSVETPKH